MLLATLLLPALTSASAPFLEPRPSHDPIRFDISYALPAEPASTRPLSTQRQVMVDEDYPLTRDHYPWYFGFHGGFTTTSTSDDEDVEVDFDDGYLLGAALGYRWGPPTRGEANFAGELELLWTDQDADSSIGPINLGGSTDQQVLGVLLNGLVDWLFTERFGIYAGAGIGMAWVDVGRLGDDTTDFDEEDGPFLTWQAKAGLQRLMGERATLRLGYRFLNIDDVELDDNFSDAKFDLETRQHVIELGLLFGF